MTLEEDDFQKLSGVLTVTHNAARRDAVAMIDKKMLRELDSKIYSSSGCTRESDRRRVRLRQRQGEEADIVGVFDYTHASDFG